MSAAGRPPPSAKVRPPKKTVANCAYDTEALWIFKGRRSCRFVRSPVMVTKSTGPTANPGRNPPSSGNRAAGNRFIASTIAALTTRDSTLTAP